jgi:DNA end-binding protein Ku
MAERAHWKGYLRLSLVSCPVALYPASSEREKVRFHQINRETGHRIRMQRVDDETGAVVPYENIVKGYEVSKGHSVEISDEELEAVAIEAARVIDIAQFVPAAEIDPRYYARPYYLVPDGDVGLEAFATIREALTKTATVALAQLVLSTREHVIALAPRGKGLIGILLRYPYELRAEADYFAAIPDVKVTTDMLALATHIVKSKSGHFRPEAFEDRYEAALRALITAKEKGEAVPLKPAAAPRPTANLMEALRQSLRVIEGGKGREMDAGETGGKAAGGAPKKGAGRRGAPRRKAPARAATARSRRKTG